MSVDPVKMVPIIHKLSCLVSEVCIMHLFTLFVGYICVKWREGTEMFFKFVFACVSISSLKEMFIHLIGVLKHPSLGWGRIRLRLPILSRFVSELL